MGGGAKIFILCLLGVLLLPEAVAAQQESAQDLNVYVGRGGFRVYELNDIGGSSGFKSVLEEIYKSKGHLFKSNVTIYTNSHAFTGSLIQVTGRFAVVLDKTRTGPRDRDVRALHVIDLDDITGVTAYTLD